MSKESNKKETNAHQKERKEGNGSSLYFLFYLVTRCMRLYEAVRATGAGRLACFAVFAYNMRQDKIAEQKEAFTSRSALCAREDGDGFSGSETVKEGRFFCDGSSVCKNSDVFSAFVKREARDLVNEIACVANLVIDKLAHAMFGGYDRTGGYDRIPIFAYGGYDRTGGYDRR